MMERKHSEQATMSIGWYIRNEIERLEAEVSRLKALLQEHQNEIERLEAEVSRLKALLQEHQTYQTRQGDKT